MSFGFAGCVSQSNGGQTDGNQTGGNQTDGEQPGGEQTGGNQTGNEQQGETFKYSSYLIKHDEGQSATYTFEAECTDLGNKSGPAWSGSYTGAGMITACEEASGGYVVQGLAKYMNNVYFLVVCDRDVEDAKLVLQLGNVTKYDMAINSSKYLVRVDTVITDEDLLSVEDGGAIGNWDEFFFQYHETENDDTGEYYINSWECGDITIEKPEQFTAGNVYMGDSVGYTITTGLKLKKGVNCISLITYNNDTLVGTTMAATAPAVDCIEITTTAQLGMYYKVDNGGYGVTACKIK